MSEEINLLCDSLGKQLDLYKHLLGFAKEETNCLLHSDVKGLNEIVKKKESILILIQNQENIRKGCIRKLAHLANIPGESSKVSNLKNVLADVDTIELVRVQKELNIVAKELTELNKRNSLLVENVLNYTTDMVKLYMGVANRPASYTKRGTVESVGNRICDRRV